MCCTSQQTNCKKDNANTQIYKHVHTLLEGSDFHSQVVPRHIGLFHFTVLTLYLSPIIMLTFRLM